MNSPKHNAGVQGTTNKMHHTFEPCEGPVPEGGHRMKPPSPSASLYRTLWRGRNVPAPYLPLHNPLEPPDMLGQQDSIVTRPCKIPSKCKDKG